MPEIFHEKDLRKGRCSQSGGLYLITKCLQRAQELMPDQRTNVVDALLYARSRRLVLIHAFVVMPDHWHVLIAMEAIRRGKHMYCEKPVGWSVRAAQVLRK